MTEPQQQSTVEHAHAGHTAAPPLLGPTDEHGAEWLHSAPPLPGRPRLRLLNPMSALLAAALVGAGGFLVGVLVEKGQGSSSESDASSALAARIQALRGAAGKGSAPGGSSTGASRFAPPGAAGGGAAPGGGAATVGQVAFVRHGTLYVTNLEGNTVKVTTSPASTVTRTVKSTVKGIHPGETVVVSGTADTGGAIGAQSIRIGSALGGLAARGGGGGGLAALLAGARPGAGAHANAAAGAGTGAGTGTGTGTGAKGGPPGETGGAAREPQLFGSGR
ncbi:MAG: hypothetical protein FWD42_07865 [Solirubrobacterales bacterium]|nr:hypothetical protein [Solirubrobacterales bacterium]